MIDVLAPAQQDLTARLGQQEREINRLRNWLESRRGHYGRSLAWMTHHAAVDPERKIDLSPANWRRLRETLGRFSGR